MRRGAFITIEGGEGVGKSTSLVAIEQAVRSLGHDAVVTREPGGTMLGEKVRSWILDGSHERLLPEAEALLMFAARAQHLAEVIRPALDNGKWVVCDRFTDATFAYQGGGHGVSQVLLGQLAAAIHGDLPPDLTLLLDAPVEVGFERIASRPLDHFERQGLGFLDRVRDAYLRIAAEEPHRVRVVDATDPEEAVAAAMVSHLQTFARDFAATAGEAAT
jgi:dTMP kinase